MFFLRKFTVLVCATVFATPLTFAQDGTPCARAYYVHDKESLLIEKSRSTLDRTFVLYSTLNQEIIWRSEDISHLYIWDANKQSLFDIGSSTVISFSEASNDRIQEGSYSFENWPLNGSRLGIPANEFDVLEASQTLSLSPVATASANAEKFYFSGVPNQQTLGHAHKVGFGNLMYGLFELDIAEKQISLLDLAEGTWVEKPSWLVSDSGALRDRVKHTYGLAEGLQNIAHPGTGEHLSWTSRLQSSQLEQLRANGSIASTKSVSRSAYWLANTHRTGASNRNFLVSNPDVNKGPTRVFEYDEVTGLREIFSSRYPVVEVGIAADDSYIVKINAAYQNWHVVKNGEIHRDASFNNSIGDFDIIAEIDGGYIVSRTIDEQLVSLELYDETLQNNLKSFDLSSICPNVDYGRDIDVRSFEIPTRFSAPTLSYYLTQPDSNTSDRPLIIYIKGGPSSRHDGNSLHQFFALVRAGFDVLVTNYSGTYEVNGNLKEIYDQLNANDWVRQVRDAEQYVENNFELHEEVYVIGFSNGGYIASHLIKEKRYDGAAILAGAFDLGGLMKLASPKFILGNYEFSSNVIGPDGKERFPVAGLGGVHATRKIDIFVGEKDHLFPLIGQAREAYEDYKAADLDVTLTEIPNVGHVLYEQDPEYSLENIVQKIGWRTAE